MPHVPNFDTEFQNGRIRNHVGHLLKESEATAASVFRPQLLKSLHMRFQVALLAAVLLFGCGGQGDRLSPSPELSLGLPMLGGASIDLSVGGGTGVVRSASMLGTSSAHGLMRVKNLTPEGPGWLSVICTLRRATPDARSFIQQTFSLSIIHSTALTVGSRFSLETEELKCEYDESQGIPLGGEWNSMPQDTWLCTGGVAEVTSLTDQAIGLRLTGLTFRLASSLQPEPLTINGSIAGP